MAVAVAVAVAGAGAGARADAEAGPSAQPAGASSGRSSCLSITISLTSLSFDHRSMIGYHSRVWPRPQSRRAGSAWWQMGQSRYRRSIHSLSPSPIQLLPHLLCPWCCPSHVATPDKRRILIQGTSCFHVLAMRKARRPSALRSAGVRVPSPDVWDTAFHLSFTNNTGPCSTLQGTCDQRLTDYESIQRSQSPNILM